MRFPCLLLVLACGCYESTLFEGVLPPRDSGTDARRPGPDVGPRPDASIDAFRPPDAPPMFDAGFDAGPGGDRCTGGETFVWVLGVIEPIRSFDGTRADGFDLDDRISSAGDPEGCSQQDFVAFDGTRGIDNQFASLIPTLESVGEGSLDMLYFEIFLEGDPPVLIEARHVDDLANDDCIDVLVHRGRYDDRGAPRFEMINYAPGQLFRSFESFRYADASIQRRTLTARGGVYPFALPIAGTIAVNRLRDAQIRADVVGDQLSRILAGGRWQVEAAVESIVGAGDLPPDVVRSVLESIADLAPGPDGTCTGISVGVRHANGVDAVLR